MDLGKWRKGCVHSIPANTFTADEFKSILNFAQIQINRNAHIYKSFDDLRHVYSRRTAFRCKISQSYWFRLETNTFTLTSFCQMKIIHRMSALVAQAIEHWFDLKIVHHFGRLNSCSLMKITRVELKENEFHPRSESIFIIEPHLYHKEKKNGSKWKFSRDHCVRADLFFFSLHNSKSVQINSTTFSRSDNQIIWNKRFAETTK